MIEAQGIATASITMLPEITKKVGPPRAISVPFALGYPLGAPGDAALQRRVLRALLRTATQRELPWLGALEKGA